MSTVRTRLMAFGNDTRKAFALVSVAAAMQVRDGRIDAVRLALGGVAAKPWRAREAERILAGAPATPAP